MAKSRGWRRLFGVGLVIAVPLLAVLLVQHIRVSQAEHKCLDNLWKLGLAIQKYEEQEGKYPSATFKSKEGQVYSWRVALLPFLDRKDLYDAYHFDEPWNGPNNLRLLEQMPDVFGCPGDSSKPKGNANYVAIIGSQTCWPGPNAISRRNLIDGMSNTIQVIEIDHSDIPWLEPRDIALRDLIPPDADELGPRFSSPHPNLVHVALCDGSARGVPKTILWSTLMAAVTPASGQPFEGKWLPGEEPVVTADFPAEINASQLRATTVTPVLDGRLAAAKNQIYCATFQLAWQDLGVSTGVAPEVAEDSGLSAALNRANFPTDALNKGSYVARAGFERDGIRAKIREEMAQRFPTITPSLSTSVPEVDAIAYAFLQKNLPFEVKFDVLRDPLIFHGSDGDTSVKSFGFKELEKATGSKELLKKQTKILHYQSDDEFAVRLKSKSDEIILAKTAPSGTLHETLDAVKKKIAASEGDANLRPLDEKDSLAVPRIAFNILRHFDELIGKSIKNKPPFLVGDARQSIRFLLNESGARLVSEVLYSDWMNGHSKPPEPPKPRHIVFDKPFLLYVQKPRAERPYLIAWVANAEIMAPKR
jgi:hypothetical protein